MGVSVADAQAAFKKGAQSAQEDVNILVATMKNSFGGLSATLAGTVSGAFQILKNQLSELAGSFGQVLAPIAGLLMDALEEIIPILSAVVELFKALEFGIGALLGPLMALQQAFPVIALSIEAVGAAVGMLMIAFESLNTVAGVWVLAISAALLLMQLFGAETEDLAAKQAEAKQQQEQYNAAVKNSADLLAGYGIKLTQGAESLQQFQQREIDMALGLKDVADAFLHAGTSVDSFNSVMGMFEKQFPQIAAQLQLLAAAAQAIGKAGPEAAGALAILASQAQALVAGTLSASTATDNFGERLKQLQANVNTTKAAMDAANAGYAETGKGAGIAQAATAAYNQALAALNGTVGTHTSAMKSDNEAIKEAEQNTLAWNKALDATAKIFDDSSTGFGAMLATAQRAASSMDEFRVAAQGANLALSPMEKMIAANDAEIAAGLSKWYALSDAQKQSVADLDAANQKLKEMAPLMDLAADAAKQMPPALDATKASATAFATTMTNLWTAVQAPVAAHNAALKELNAGYQALGLEVHKAGTDTISLLTDMATAIDSGKFSTLQLDDAWIKFGTTASKAGLLTDEIVQKMQAMGAPMQIVLDAQIKSLTAQQQIAQYTDLTGQSELVLAERIQDAKNKQDALNQAAMGLANEYAGIVTALGKAWDDLGKSIADSIVAGQGFGAAMKTVLDNLAKQILEQIVGTAMKDLKASILENTDAAGMFNKLFNGIFGAGGSVAQGLGGASTAVEEFSGKTGDALKSLANGAGDFAGEVTSSVGKAADSTTAAATSMSNSMQQTATSVASSASTMISGLNLVASAVSAIASIFSAIELAHTNTLLARIEESTRRTDITVEGAIVTSLHLLDEYLPDIWKNSFQIMADMHTAAVEIGSIPSIMTAMLAEMGAIVSGQSNESSINPVLQQLIADLNNLVQGTIGYNPTPTDSRSGIATAFGPVTTAAGAIQAAAVQVSSAATDTTAAAASTTTAAAATSTAATSTSTAAAASTTAASATSSAANVTTQAATAVADAATKIQVAVGSMNEALSNGLDAIIQGQVAGGNADAALLNGLASVTDTQRAEPTRMRHWPTAWPP